MYYRSLLSEDRLMVINNWVKTVAHLHGDFAELGVYKGGVARLLTRTAPSKILHLYDTFTGMPPEANVDIHKEGDFADTDLENVKQYVSNPLAIYHQGIFGGNIPDKIML